jgi:ribosomal protein L34
VFQKQVALVVLGFAAAMAALVGATVINARRR